MGTSASDLPGPTPRRWGAPASKFDLLLVLRPPSGREQRGERPLVAGDGRRKKSAARRRITARRIQDRAGRNVLPGGLEHASPAIAEIGGATALGAPGGNFRDGLVGLFSEPARGRKPVRPRDAARPVAVIEGLDPQIDGARVALQ